MNTTVFWNHFEALRQVPRTSGHCEKVIRFLSDYAASLQLSHEVTEGGNLLVRIPASPGREADTPLILQGHVDMVYQNDGVSHDPLTDPITCHEENGWLKADGTTLGADNGMAVAAMMTVMGDASLSHPALECLFTVDEEIGMLGAFALPAGVLQGETLLNLDTENEEELVVGCCGAVRVHPVFRYVPEPVPEGDQAYKITISGLLGGHSGMDIHLQRANAVKLAAHLLKSLVTDCEARLAWMEGGNVSNAIPRQVELVVTLPDGAEDDLYEVIAQYQEIYSDEYGAVDPDILLEAEAVPLPASLLPECVQDDLINALVAAPDGVIRRQPDDPATLETSSNLGCIHSSEGRIEIEFLVRSTRYSMKGEVRSRLESIFSLAGASVSGSDDYEGWQPNYDSPVLAKVRRIYPQVFGHEPRVCLVHAGLECGILAGRYPYLDMISFGPNILHPHSTGECVETASVERFLSLLEKVLAD
ncbi:MAG: beta-Ala-His dipeptidase [Paludibacteraceae bacterium]|nr:beta-Ala-His dipeptidase [Paludibacteraceae bacterium]